MLKAAILDKAALFTVDETVKYFTKRRSKV